MTDLSTAPTNVDAIEVASDQETVLITEQQVVFATAAAVAVPPARTSNWVVGAVHAFADALRGALAPPAPRHSSRVSLFETAELTDAASPWYRRPGILIAAAALIAEVGIVVSGPGEPGTAPGGTTGTSTPWSPSFSLIATWWVPPPPAPPPPAAAPPAPAPRRAARPTYEPPAYEPPAYEPPQAAPPPPPPPQLVLRYDDPLTTAFVSITNNDKPAVDCVQRTVPVAGIAARINFPVPDVNFTVTGSEETRLPAGASRGVGPATGSTFNVTVTCDNGLSTSQEKIY